MTTFILNDKEIKTSLPKGLLLLDFIRYHLLLTGTKIGCREGDCGACTILVGEIKNEALVYSSATCCLMPIGNAEGKHIVTIEGINTNELNSVQQAFAEEGATQCGFCTPGFIVSLTGHCINDTPHNYEAAIDAMNGNICRCTGYKSIERAAKKVSDKIQQNEQPALQYAIRNNFIPAYFSGIQERLKALSAAPTNGLTNKKKILGGGTDLYVQQHEAMVNEEIDFFFNKENLKGISINGNTCYMGAAVTVTDVETSGIFKKHFPALQRYIKLVSSTQIRNMATIAGNFVNASPIGDFSIFFLALNAQLHVSNGQAKRVIPLRNFYKGYKHLDKSPDEYIEGFDFELPSGTDYFNFEKVSKRTCLDIASVNSSMHLVIKDDLVTAASLSAGGVGPIPMFLTQASGFLTGKNISDELIAELLEIVQSEISPISDARGTEMYKRLLLSQLIKAHFICFFPQMPVQNLLAV